MKSKWFTIKDTNKLIQDCINFGLLINIYKLRAIIYFMIYTGANRAQVLNFQREDVDFDKGCVILRHKISQKEKIVYVRNRLLEILKQYFGTEPPGVNGFCITQGQYHHIFRVLAKHQTNKKKFTLRSIKMLWRKNEQSKVRFKRKKV